MAKRKKPALQLLVVFDTNVLYTQVASDLVKAEIRNLIKDNSSHTDVSIKWFLPSVVIDERRYQMPRKAFELLPSLQKLEKLLGHNLNITKEILIQRVNESILSSLEELNLTELKIDTSSIDWEELIRRSSFREPPFEPTEKEKGFRDSLIAESFFQLKNDSPASPSVCRLAIVTEDSVLSDFLRKKTSDAKNIRILSTLKELESLINTLVSTVTEEFVAEIKDKARVYFFEKDNLETLYFKENIPSRIKEKYPEALSYRPSESLTRENGTWWIDAPVFIKKVRQRVYWTTQIAVDYELYKYEYQKSVSPEPSSPGNLVLGETQQTALNIQPTLLTDILSSTPKKVQTGKGRTLFEVDWSVNITQNKKLTSPNIIDIKFIEHSKEEQ